MRTRWVLLSIATAGCGVCQLGAQAPVLSSIEAPYPAVQASVTVAGGNYGAGAVPYGPVDTPLVLTGSNLGTSGTVQFIGYKNGAVDPGTTVQATVSLWTQTILIIAKGCALEIPREHRNAASLSVFG